MPKAVRSLEWRRKQSLQMHRMVSKLLKLKKMRAMQQAPPSTLKKRSQHLAHTILRKKVAGAQGADYSNLSPSQKMTIDRLMQRVPSSAVSKLAKRLLPVVQRHEKERLIQARKGKNAKSTAAAKELVSESKSHKARMRAGVTAYRKKMHHRRTAKVVKGIAAGGGEKADLRNDSRLGLAAIKKRLGRGSGLAKGGAKRFNKKLVDDMRDALRSGNATDKNVRKKSKANKHRVRHKTRSHRGSMGQTAQTKSHYKAGVLSADFDMEMDCLSDMIVERNMNKFEQLFIRGLVPKQKIEIYKRIFKDLESNIRLRRYHDEVIDIIDTMIKLITTDNTIYYRVRNNLQKNQE